MESQTLQWKMKTKVGTVYLVASEKGLQALYLDQDPKLKNARSLKESKILAETVKELDEYFAGKRTKFEIPLDLQGTPFQKKVWTALTKIPYGKTYSYKELAGKINNPKAMRAVGSANGKNPICIIVPCHRVIAADGSIGGYSGGLPVKKALLDLESSH